MPAASHYFHTPNVQEANPRLNRGGTHILYEAKIENNLDLYKMGIDGSGVTRLTSDKAKDYEADWSPA